MATTLGVRKRNGGWEYRVEAASKRYLTYFISCHDLIQNLRKAYNENRLEARLKHYNKYKLLIIDEIGYLPIDKLGANLFFQLITKRYEHNSTIITTKIFFAFFYTTSSHLRTWASFLYKKKMFTFSDIFIC